MKNKVYILLFVFIGIFEKSIFAQSIDSISFHIEYNERKQDVNLYFLNHSSNHFFMAWNDAYPYICFFESPLEINVYVGRNDTIQMLKIVGNEPSFDGNTYFFELKSKEKTMKTINLKYLISKEDMAKYEYVLVKYKWKIDISNSIDLKDTFIITP